MREICVKIRKMRPDETELLREFLYQAIYLPEGVEPPPRSVLDLPQLRVYIDGFGTRAGDCCVVAEARTKLVGAAWGRIMEDYGHIDDRTPSLAVSVLPEHRGRGIGTCLLETLLVCLQEAGYPQVSLSVQKDNPALHLYLRKGFAILDEQGTEFLMLRPLQKGADETGEVWQ